jgi:DnaJ-class molecular chaperone
VTGNDAWDGPACSECRGRGQIVLTRGNHWTAIACDACHGTGHANAEPPVHYRDDGTRIPQDGEEYDEAIHGPPGPAYATSDAVGCRTCFGARVVISRTLVETPCPACTRPSTPPRGTPG